MEDSLTPPSLHLNLDCLSPTQSAVKTNAEMISLNSYAVEFLFKRVIWLFFQLLCKNITVCFCYVKWLLHKHKQCCGEFRLSHFQTMLGFFSFILPVSVLLYWASQSNCWETEIFVNFLTFLSLWCVLPFPFPQQVHFPPCDRDTKNVSSPPRPARLSWNRFSFGPQHQKTIYPSASALWMARILLNYLNGMTKNKSSSVS